MVSVNTLYFGIDPASSNKDFTFAVLDSSLNVVELADANLAEMVALLDEQPAAFVAINAPARVNRGLVKKKFNDENANPSRLLRGVDIRLAEYELRERGIAVAGTSSREEFCPSWMQVGFVLYQKLPKMGFKNFGIENTTHQFLETHPYASYCALLEMIPFPKNTLEGRLQRQLILYDKGLQIADPMNMFEEITRFRLLKGILPMDVLYSLEHLDVFIAAYTAWCAANQPEEVTMVGDRSEGQVILPVRELQEKY